MNLNEKLKFCPNWAYFPQIIPTSSCENSSVTSRPTNTPAIPCTIHPMTVPWMRVYSHRARALPLTNGSHTHFLAASVAATLAASFGVNDTGINQSLPNDAAPTHTHVPTLAWCEWDLKPSSLIELPSMDKMNLLQCHLWIYDHNLCVNGP